MHRKILLIGFVTLLLVLSLAPISVAQDDAEETFDPGQIAIEYIDLALAENFESAAELHDETMRNVFPADTFARTWESIFVEAGNFQSRELVSIQNIQGFRVVRLLLKFENGDFLVSVPINLDGEVAGLNAVAATPPPYADPESFTETNVVVNEGGDWELPGTLTIPSADGTSTADGPFAAVVFLPGSGPTDRDSTVGPNKPLRDIAQGLATKGIASLRFDKRSLIHGQNLMGAFAFTLDDEYTSDALAAVELIRAQESVDPDRVYILGHSLGATGAVRTLSADPMLTGGILMAGSPLPLQDAAIRQIEYLSTLESNQFDAAQAQMDAMLAQLTEIEAITEETPEDQAFFGAYTAYWLDLAENPVGQLAETLSQPLLILQGERDYQATMDDFTAWQEVLTDKTDVTFMSYPALNHLFLEGEGVGKSTPDEYVIPGNVPESVINDIVEWIMSQ